MKQIRHQATSIEKISPDDSGHFFFGYYDLQPWNAEESQHLCHKVTFMDRMPCATDRAQLGAIRSADHRFVPLAETSAWNFQQGAMLQWNSRNPGNEILYNARRDGAFKGALKNIRSGKTQCFDRPLANVSKDGTKALSINFSRLADFRPGYGYAGIPDPFLSVPAPENDGIFSIDLVDDKTELILPLATIAGLFVDHFGNHLKGAKVLVNHITFNPSATRFVFQARTMGMPGQEIKGWLTLVATADITGRRIHVFDGGGNASHYCWRDDDHILIYADLAKRGQMNLCLAKDKTQDIEILDPDFFAFDGHCSFSPDKNSILYDSYPDADHYRKLLLYDLRTNTGTVLAELLSVPPACEDIRCDLHPRWNHDGLAISFDSTHEGHRGVYEMNLKDIRHDEYCGYQISHFT